MAHEHAWFQAFLESLGRLRASELKLDAQTLKARWCRFVQLSELDPYTPERLHTSERWREDQRCQDWVQAALEMCRSRDSEFSLVLEETLTDRFHLAIALVSQESLL